MVTHAAAAVQQEEQLARGPLQLGRLRQQVRAEVEHEHGAAQDVLMVALPHKLQLQGRNIRHIPKFVRKADIHISTVMISATYTNGWIHKIVLITAHTIL